MGLTLIAWSQFPGFPGSMSISNQSRLPPTLRLSFKSAIQSFSVTFPFARNIDFPCYEMPCSVSADAIRMQDSFGLASHQRNCLPPGISRVVGPGNPWRQAIPLMGSQAKLILHSDSVCGNGAWHPVAREVDIPGERKRNRKRLDGAFEGKPQRRRQARLVGNRHAAWKNRELRPRDQGQAHIPQSLVSLACYCRRFFPTGGRATERATATTDFRAGESISVAGHPANSAQPVDRQSDRRRRQLMAACTLF